MQLIIKNEYKLNNEADKKLMKSTGLQSNSTSSPSMATYSRKNLTKYLHLSILIPSSYDRNHFTWLFVGLNKIILAKHLIKYLTQSKCLINGCSYDDYCYHSYYHVIPKKLMLKMFSFTIAKVMFKLVYPFINSAFLNWSNFCKVQVMKLSIDIL